MLDRPWTVLKQSFNNNLRRDLYTNGMANGSAQAHR